MNSINRIAYEVCPSEENEEIIEREAPLVDPILPYVTHQNVSIKSVKEIKDYMELQLTGVDKDALRAIREAFSHLYVMAIKEVVVRHNDTLTEIEPIKAQIKSIPLDVDAKDYDLLSSNSKISKALHLFMSVRAYSGPRENNTNIWMNKKLPAKKITTGQLYKLILPRQNKNMTANTDEKKMEDNSEEQEEDQDTYDDESILSYMQGEEVDNDDYTSISQEYYNNMSHVIDKKQLEILARAVTYEFIGQRHYLTLIQKKYFPDVSTKQIETWIRDPNFVAIQRTIRPPVVCLSYCKPGQGYPELFRFRTPENIIRTRSPNNPFINPNAASKLGLYATAVKGCEYENPGNREFAIFTKCAFDSLLHFKTLNERQVAQNKARVPVTKLKEDEQGMKDSHDLVLGSNWEHNLDEYKRQYASSNATTIDASYIAKRCPNQVFDIEEAETYNKLYVRHANRCDRCGMCVRADTSEKLYFRPRNDYSMWFMLQTRGPYSAACVFARGVEWIATQSFDQWIKATQFNPSPMTQKPHPDYPTTQPDFFHLIGPPSNQLAYQQIQSLWTIMKQDSNWQRVLQDRSQMYTNTVNSSSNSIPFY